LATKLGRLREGIAATGSQQDGQPVSQLVGRLNDSLATHLAVKKGEKATHRLKTDSSASIAAYWSTFDAHRPPKKLPFLAKSTPRSCFLARAPMGAKPTFANLVPINFASAPQTPTPENFRVAYYNNQPA